MKTIQIDQVELCLDVQDAEDDSCHHAVDESKRSKHILAAKEPFELSACCMFMPSRQEIASITVHSTTKASW